MRRQWLFTHKTGLDHDRDPSRGAAAVLRSGFQNAPLPKAEAVSLPTALVSSVTEMQSVSLLISRHWTRWEDLPVRNSTRSSIVLVRLGHLRQFVSECIDHKLETIVDAELGVNRAEVMRDCGGTDEEPLGDLSIL